MRAPREVCKRVACHLRDTGGMTAPSRLQLLGGVEVFRDDEPKPIGGPKATRLLSILAAHIDGGVSIDRIIESLWDGRPPKSATSTVQSQVSRLRAVLEPSFTIVLESGGYRLVACDGEIDAVQFEKLLTRSRTLDAAQRIETLEAALELWRGRAFGQYADDAEVRSEAVRLDELRLVATDDWAEQKIAAGHNASMVGELEALVSLHPLRECYSRLLMLALYRTGRQAEALRRASELRLMLVEDLGLDVSSAVRELEARILADDPALLATNLGRVPGAVPALQSQVLLGATSFIGRDLDVEALSVAVRDQPLITITGPGGVGKTRVAMRVAASVVDTFDDGVIVAEFAALRDPEAVAQIIAHALDIQQRQYRTIESTIVDYLAPTSMLLLLDNCEHVTDALAPMVDRLRSSCPRLRILATSREPLGLAGEYVEVLSPLDIPTSTAETADEIRGCDAVELFMSRARAAIPGLMLTDSNAAGIAGICRRLDGLPLGLELAAARLRTMGVDALNDLLNQRIGLFGQAQRGADGRRRTLHNLVAWSHSLLEDEEQRVFEQLAVFAGGFDLSAAEAVCSTSGGAGSTVDTLASLVDKSMVLMVDHAVPRYRMLETLRDFAHDRLTERGILEATQHQHLNWFLALAEQGAEGLDGADEAAWSEQLARDFDNFRAAHGSALRQVDTASALRLVVALREFGIRRVQYELASWADASVSLPGASEDPNVATVLAVSAYGRWVQGEMQAAMELAQRSLEAAEGGPSASGLAERVMCNVLFYMERSHEAFEWTDRMLASARQAGSQARIAHALYMKSVGETSIGGGIRGALFAGESKAAADAAESPTALAQAGYAMGLALENTAPEEALALLERASVGGAAAGNRWIEAFSLTEVHWLRARQGSHMAALTGYGEVVDTWYRGGDWVNQWMSLRRVLGLLIDIGAFEAAAVLYGALAAVGAAHAVPFGPGDDELLSRSVDELRSVLGPADFSDNVRKGSSMKDREIVSFVRQRIDDLTSRS